jgi:hypothetical protein
MRAPRKAPAPSRLDEIVTEIVNLLVSKEHEPDGFAAGAVVRSTIQLLKNLAQNKPLWGSKKANNQALSNLRKNVGDLLETLRGMPSEMLVLLSIEKLSEQFPTSLMQHKANQRLKAIIAVLGYLQERCDQLLTKQPGEHGNADFSQRLVAEEAWRLMKYHNLDPASGTHDSAYGSIAGLLFEAVTEQDKDLQRACKSVLKRAKDGELSEWRGDPIFKGRLPM